MFSRPLQSLWKFPSNTFSSSIQSSLSLTSSFSSSLLRSFQSTTKSSFPSSSFSPSSFPLSSSILSDSQRTFATKSHSSAPSSSSTPSLPFNSSSPPSTWLNDKGFLPSSTLQSLISLDRIGSVQVVFTDMYGRLMGKRFDPKFFIESALKGGTHGCDYLLACDMEMSPQKGYDLANWEKGFGDFHFVPQLDTISLLSWTHNKERNQYDAMVQCDLYNDKTHSPISPAPRNVLKKQIDKLNTTMNCTANAATELEYYQYETSYRAAHAANYSNKILKPTGDYYEDYHMLQSAREEKYTREFRHHLAASGIPVENSKGECGIGQHELNVKYSDILTMSDRHQVYKQCIKEVADQLGVSVTFMAKPYTEATGSGCHIHLSMVDKVTGKNIFQGDEKFGPVQCSNIFKYFLGGWMKYTPDVMVFYAPTVNSYKRFVSSSWAPTRLAWSYDNRTAGFRVVGKSASLRIEMRIPGADCNPYLAFAASLASGMRGIKDQIQPPSIFEGNIYEAQQLPHVPKTLREATEIFKNSAFAKESFGEEVVKHYTNFYTQEQNAYDTFVSDWERVRYFERI